MIPSPDVVRAAQGARAKTRVPASVSIAQYALESAWGRDMPPGSNNPFGIKGVGEPNAVWAMTREVIHGCVVHERQPFRRFASLEDAFAYHGELIATDHRYAEAMAALPDLKRFVRLMGAHYATDPDYADKLLTLIREDGLTRFDGP